MPSPQTIPPCMRWQGKNLQWSDSQKRRSTIESYVHMHITREKLIVYWVTDLHLPGFLTCSHLAENLRSSKNMLSTLLCSQLSTFLLRNRFKLYQVLYHSIFHCRDHFALVASQWEMTLQCNIVLASHPCTCVLHRQGGQLHTLKLP